MVSVFICDNNVDLLKTKTNNGIQFLREILSWSSQQHSHSHFLSSEYTYCSQPPGQSNLSTPLCESRPEVIHASSLFPIGY